jgi:hypothetical protein
MKSHVVRPDDYIMLHGARYVKLEKVDNCIREEVNKRIEDLYGEVAKDVVAQVSAVFLTVLNKELDFDGTRLRCVADGVKSMVKIMNDKTLSKDFTIDDCVKYLKEKFNIDVHEME